MKRILALTLLFTAVAVPVHADPAPTIAVIDMGFNTSLYSDSVVAEACFVEFSTCLNGKQSMEGPGASVLPSFTTTTLNHGTQMVSVIKAVNPSAKLVLIRIVGVSNGLQLLYTNNAVKQALDWVVANRVKYNISVVNVSQGGIKAGCSVPAGTAADVASLKANNVPVIASTGNDSNRTAINSIACLPDVVSVGATDNPDPGITGKAYDKTAKPYIARYSNGDPTVDFYLNGRWYVTNYNGTTKFMVGTSNATASLSAWWLLNRKATFDATYTSFTTIPASNEWLIGKYIALP
jgi:hypothetical protein